MRVVKLLGREVIAKYLSLILFVALTLSVPSKADDELLPNVSAAGDISFPKNFRETMTHLGSWFVPEGGASGFHDVYTSKDAVDYYQANGVFPDGAVIVKELRAANSGDFTTGANVQYSTSGLKQWFVMIKDSQNRYAENPLWGEGWGWALFKPDQLDKNLATDYKVDCMGCHVPAASTDWIYTQAYPILSD